MAAAEKIAKAIATRVDAEEALKEAESEERKAYREAERNGWTKTELNKLKPVKKRHTPQQKKNTARAEDTSHTSSDNSANNTAQTAESSPASSTTQHGVMTNV